ncbi:MAG: hypothetical protein FWD53_13210 [Phycisphaerales bacterium]|nr:hypothetical protein [Phycisphaerales bacterium]
MKEATCNSIGELILLAGMVLMLAACNGRVAERPIVAPAEVCKGDDTETVAYRKTVALLAEPVEFSVKDQPLGEVLELISDKGRVPMFVNWTSLQGCGIDKNIAITLQRSSMARSGILKSVLQLAANGSVNLDSTIDNDGVLHVSSVEDLQSAKYQVVRTYSIGSIFLFRTGGHTVADYFKDIIYVIETTVAPDTWKQQGGMIGTICELDGKLIVNQTLDNHRAIAELLKKLWADRARVYDVRDLVGTSNARLVELMDMIQSLSSDFTWKNHGGSLAAMRGLNGCIYVTGADLAHDELNVILGLIRKDQAPRGNARVVKPTGINDDSFSQQEINSPKF